MTDLKHRDQITTAALAGVAPSTPVTVMGSTQGYAIAVGPAECTRWLHTTSGQFKVFRSLDTAVAVLKACGLRRFALDISAGCPQ
jgi:hypothetical protein